MKIDKGYIHIYTGNGKGKTTAALGLSLRAVGAGYRVFFAQFLKKRRYSEMKSLDRFFPKIVVQQYGLEDFCKDPHRPSKQQIKAARAGLRKVKEAIASRQYELIILDEINIAVYFNLLDEDEILDILKNKPDNLELVLTGRNAPKCFYKFADLITEMKEIKHYFNQGVGAREGIEF